MTVPKVVLSLALLTLCPRTWLHAQGTPSPIVGWYNGDWQNGVGPGVANWYVSNTQSARVYDDFVVPTQGWTVVGVYSNCSLSQNAPPVTLASWEIRLGLQSGFGGGVVASGIASVTPVANANKFDYRIEVDNLKVVLPAGRYWLSVTPVTVNTGAYLSGTVGQNAIGDPPGTDGDAFVYNAFTGTYWLPPETLSASLAKDFSQGVMVAPPSIPIPDQWRTDVASLVQQMLADHTVPFPPPGVSVADFTTAAADLLNRIPDLSDAGIRTGTQALVASIQDPHTDLGWGSPSPFKLLPLSFYWFDDGLYVTAAPPAYANLLGGKLVSIGQTNIDDATQRLAALVPHENDQWPKFQIPLTKLTNTDFLFGTGITPDTSGAQIVVQNAAGDLISADVAGPGPRSADARLPGPSPLLHAAQGPALLGNHHRLRRHRLLPIQQLYRGSRATFG